MKGVRLKQTDQQYLLHELAYKTMMAKATRKSGKKVKPVYRNFKQFFDYDKSLKEVLGEEKKEDQYADLSRFVVAKANHGNHGKD